MTGGFNFEHLLGGIFKTLLHASTTDGPRYSFLQKQIYKEFDLPSTYVAMAIRKGLVGPCENPGRLVTLSKRGSPASH